MPTLINPPRHGANRKQKADQPPSDVDWRATGRNFLITVATIVVGTVAILLIRHFVPDLIPPIMPAWKWGWGALITWSVAAIAGGVLNIPPRGERPDYPQSPLTPLGLGAVATIIGLFEELEYRWVAFHLLLAATTLLLHQPVLWLAGALVAALFGIRHWHRGNVISASIMGVALLWVALNYGILGAIIAHAIFDFSGVMVIYLILESRR